MTQTPRTMVSVTDGKSEICYPKIKLEAIFGHNILEPSFINELMPFIKQMKNHLQDERAAELIESVLESTASQEVAAKYGYTTSTTINLLKKEIKKSWNLYIKYILEPNKGELFKKVSRISMRIIDHLPLVNPEMFEESRSELES